MLGFRLIWLGLVGLIKKFPHAVAVSMLPGLAMYVGLAFVDTVTDRMPVRDLYIWVVWIGYLIVTTPLTAWAVTNWQRVIILSEWPNAFPHLKDWIWARFTGRLGVLALGLWGFYAVVLFGIDVLFIKFGESAVSSRFIALLILGILFVSFLASTWVTARFLPCLSAVAIGDRMTFRQSWRQTADYTPTIVVISLSMLFIVFGMIILTAVFLPSFFVGLPVIIWLGLAICVAVITEFSSYIRAQNDVVEVFQ